MYLFHKEDTRRTQEEDEDDDDDDDDDLEVKEETRLDPKGFNFTILGQQRRGHCWEFLRPGEDPRPRPRFRSSWLKREHALSYSCGWLTSCDDTDLRG